MELDKLKAFRQEAYKHLGKARDATFELTDAVLLTRTAYCLAELSLSPVFRRRWPSIYEALQDSRPQRNKLMQLYIKQMPTDVRPLLAGDHTVWPRPNAVTLQERTIEHYCTNVPGNRPITKGQGYSTLAWIPEATGSWALPLRHERITSWENPIEKAVWQLTQVCRYLPARPITLWDSEYGCAPFILKTAEIAADKLIRLRSNLCLWSTPAVYSGKGRPRIHGDPLATLSASAHSWSGRSGDGWSFSRNGNTRTSSQTSWKVSWLAGWQATTAKNPLSCCQKRYKKSQKTALEVRLNC